VRGPSHILDVAVGLFGAAMSTAGTLELNSGSGRGSIGSRIQEIPFQMIETHESLTFVKSFV